MEVLLVHNSYRSDSPSGEQRVVDDEAALLRAAGVAVEVYSRSSDEIADLPLLRKVELPARPIWSREDTRRFGKVVAQARPDVVHVHNVYPLISPGVIRVADELGVPVVQTVHNYRHVCVNGSYFRDGHVCTDCSGKATAWPAVAHGCYRGSRAQSLIMATSLRTHASTWQRVRLFLPVTQFMADHLESAGIAPGHIKVKPNFAADPGIPGPAGSTLLYVGRLAEEKGLGTLLSSWARSRHPAFSELVVAGDGPLRSLVETAAATDPSIRYLGILSRERVATAMSQAGAVVVPSLWFEGFPITVVEAYAHGRPVIATDIGSLGSVVDDEIGWSFPNDPRALRDVLDAIKVEELSSKGRAARARFLESFSPDAALHNLLAAYDLAMSPAASTGAPIVHPS